MIRRLPLNLFAYDGLHISTQINSATLCLKTHDTHTIVNEFNSWITIDPYSDW